MYVARDNAEAQQSFYCGTNVTSLRRVTNKLAKLLERINMQRENLREALLVDEGAWTDAVRELCGVLGRRVLAPEWKPNDYHATLGFLQRIPAHCLLWVQFDSNWKRWSKQPHKMQSTLIQIGTRWSSS